MKKYFFTLLFVMVAGVFSATAQGVIGQWKTIDDETGEAKSIVEIYEKDGKIYGKVIKILNPAKRDAKCTECKGSDKNKPILGMVIIKGLERDDDEYTDGKILDPNNGKLYSCTIKLDGKDKLEVRGYIGFSFIGRSQTWTRV